MIFHWSFVDIKSQVSRTLLSILTDLNSLDSFSVFFKSPGLFSVFWQISIILLTEWSQVFLWFPITQFFFRSLWRLFQVHQLLLVSPSPTCFTVFLGINIYSSFRSLLFSHCGQPERQNRQVPSLLLISTNSGLLAGMEIMIIIIAFQLVIMLSWLLFATVISLFFLLFFILLFFSYSSSFYIFAYRNLMPYHFLQYIPIPHQIDTHWMFALVWFLGISNFLGYLMPKPFL